MIFFSLITTAFSAIFYGIIATAVLMALLYVALKGISKSIVQTIVFYLTGVVLGILLIVQFSLMIGAMQAKDAADSSEIYLEQLLEGQHGIVGAQDSQRIMDALTERFPMIDVFVNVANFSGHDISELPAAMHDSMIDYLNSFIWHRVWWSLAIIVVACVIVMLYDKKALTKGTPKRKATMASRKNYDDF